MILKQGKQKKIAILLDPEKEIKNLEDFILKSEQSGIDYFFVGGSIVTKSVDLFVEQIKKISKTPVILFPGDYSQFTNKADAILYLSLISGRNPEYLINQHIENSVLIKESKIEVIPTGYILIDGGKITSVQKVSNTEPIPQTEVDKIVSTAVAGELLGMKVIYLEAGSGAKNPVSEDIIKSVRQNIDVLLIVGGGLREISDIKKATKAGADIIVVGNFLEENPEKIQEIVNAVKS